MKKIIMLLFVLSLVGTIFISTLRAFKGTMDKREQVVPATVAEVETLSVVTNLPRKITFVVKPKLGEPQK